MQIDKVAPVAASVKTNLGRGGSARIAMMFGFAPLGSSAASEAANNPDNARRRSVFIGLEPARHLRLIDEILLLARRFPATPAGV